MRQLQFTPTLKWVILINFGWFYRFRFCSRFRTFGPDRKGEFDWEFGIPYMLFYISFNPVIPSTGWDSQYDLHFDLFTGEYLESICRCEPGTCEFTDAYIKAGEPTYYDGPDGWAVSLERMLRRIFPSRIR